MHNDGTVPQKRSGSRTATVQLLSDMGAGATVAVTVAAWRLGCSSVLPPWLWPLHFRVETWHVHAERLLAKVGGSNCKPWGIPTLATRAQRKWKGRSAAEVCTREARKIGEWLAGARGYLPLAVLAVAAISVPEALRRGWPSPQR